MKCTPLGRFQAWMMLLVLWMLLAACQEKPAKEKMTSVTVYGYSHRDEGIYFSLNGGGSGRAAAHGQSGGSCCLAVPLQWKPGVEVEVEWSLDLKHWDSQVVTVPKYDGESATRIGVHFLGNENIKVFVTHYLLGHPSYPLQGAEAELTPGVPPGAPWWRDPLPTDVKENKQ